MPAISSDDHPSHPPAESAPPCRRFGGRYNVSKQVFNYNRAQEDSQIRRTRAGEAWGSTSAEEVVDIPDRLDVKYGQAVDAQGRRRFTDTTCPPGR
ncbi:hypothetical protein LTR53_019679, partial [Teratosphaeriaceae sp. CCFEE 6253]